MLLELQSTHRQANREANKHTGQKREWQGLLGATNKWKDLDLKWRPSFQPEQTYCPLNESCTSWIRAPRLGSMVTFMLTGRCCPLPWMSSSGWKVSLVTDGSVSRHLYKKSWPSFTLGLLRGVTNTVEGSAGSVREAAKDLWVFCKLVLTSKFRLWLHVILPFT